MSVSVKASRNWEDEILNYFATGKEVTNALTESLNRKIRDKNRDGRGYSFDVLRGKILFSTPHKTRRVTNRSSPFKSNTTKFMKNSLICFNAQSLKRTSSLTMALIYQPSKRIFCGWFEPLKSTTYSEYP